MAWENGAGRGLLGVPEDVTPAAALVGWNMPVNGSVMMPLSIHGTNSTWLDTAACASMEEAGKVPALVGQRVEIKHSTTPNKKR